MHLEHITSTGHVQVSHITHVQVNYACTSVICLEILKKKKKNLNPFFQAWRKLQSCQRNQDIWPPWFSSCPWKYDHSFFSKTEMVDINHSWNGICFRSNEAAVQRGFATLIAYVFKNKASVVCWKMFSHFSHFLCFWFEIVSIFCLLETLNYCEDG